MVGKREGESAWTECYEAKGERERETRGKMSPNCRWRARRLSALRRQCEVTRSVLVVLHRLPFDDAFVDLHHSLLTTELVDYVDYNLILLLAIDILGTRHGPLAPSHSPSAFLLPHHTPGGEGVNDKQT
mmetsp:Transcript_6350/g.20646  ORF Transcript_6350/g.20646 Transcript_6350/m.20646 type:complete len:129 (-) Transcript_6350:77-463(-)